MYIRRTSNTFFNDLVVRLQRSQHASNDDSLADDGFEGTVKPGTAFATNSGTTSTGNSTSTRLRVHNQITHHKAHPIETGLVHMAEARRPFF